MSNKKLITILVLLILILVIIINIFSRVANNGKNNNKNTNKNNSIKDENIVFNYNEKEGKYKVSVINNEYNRLKQEQVTALDNLIDKILEYINTKDYESLLAMVNKDYKEIRFVNENGEEDLETFKDHVDEFSYGQQFVCVSYRLSEGNCYVTLADKEIASSENFSKDNTFEIRIENYESPDTATICFEKSIKNIRPIATRVLIDKLIINLKYLVEYDTYSTVFVNIYNVGKEDAKIEISKFNLITNIDGSVNRLDESVSRTIESNKSINIEMTMQNSRNSIYLPNELEYLIKLNGKELEGTKAIQNFEDL